MLTTKRFNDEEYDYVATIWRRDQASPWKFVYASITYLDYNRYQRNRAVHLPGYLFIPTRPWPCI